MSPTEVLRGNASILLPNVQDADGKIYTCSVLHSPDREEKTIELRVDAPPLVKLGSTKVQLNKLNTIACTATDFYPGNISMTWFRNDKIVQGPERPPIQPSTGQLFRAESFLKLVPEFSDAKANFSCHINHQAFKGPEAPQFQLSLQARPNLQLITRPQGEKFVAALCNVSEFYPSHVNIQWLKNGEPQEQVKSEVYRMHNGMFYINSVFFPKKSDVEVTYACRVEHEALETSLEKSVLWRPEVTPTIPTAVPLWLVCLAGLGSGLILGAGITICIYKAKNNSVMGTSDEKKHLQKKDEEKLLDTSKPRPEETRSELIPTEELDNVQEQRL
ncbi:PREDICTED: tyrosine-protein phosphatase non-receptor type substrate 1-like isoform X2 [Thamnophis sirtalis]|uniref:Tyrosine-protein phosphatase non-receptor type substrate 1-like isoform X2 n=1 Tax=Thamnophis sirtalis TaxID=35019 RepID=A0A6I9XSD8_9SAUR|nr:PREDICTED: tyrosine-protein phosphatase non-receptor type substrate 1-like isoform X2 [Thamnophis sirtalis]